MQEVNEPGRWTDGQLTLTGRLWETEKQSHSDSEMGNYKPPWGGLAQFPVLVGGRTSMTVEIS